MKSLPAPFTAEQFDVMCQAVEALQKEVASLATRLGTDRVGQQDHPIIGSPLHFRSNDGQGHTTCVPCVCVDIDKENPDLITVVAFTRGGEGIGPQPASRRTDVHQSKGDHFSWHWPDDADAHAWRPPRRTEND